MLFSFVYTEARIHLSEDKRNEKKETLTLFLITGIVLSKHLNSSIHAS